MAENEPRDYLTADPDGDMPECLADVGARIRAVRESARLEQRAVAASVGVTQAGVSRWETGERDPGVAGLVRVAEALGVPASSLLPAGHQASARAETEGGGGDHAACGALLLHASVAIANERERADAAEAKAAAYESGITWGTSCLSCSAVLDSCLAETFRREGAEEKLAEAVLMLGAIGELAESWTADDGHGTPTPEMLTEAGCGRAVLDLLGEPNQQHRKPGEDEAARPPRSTTEGNESP